MATTPEEHALLSASASSCWLRCPGSLAMQRGIERRTSDDAEEGTAAHEVAAWTLASESKSALAFIGRITSNDREVTEEMCEYVQVYVDAILAKMEGYTLRGATHVHLLLEQRVNYATPLDVARDLAFGTSDAVLIAVWEDKTLTLDINDLKYGRGVPVPVNGNDQLRMYALGARDQYEVLGEFREISLNIHQPRREYTGEWIITNEDLDGFARYASYQANLALSVYDKSETHIEVQPMHLIPGEKQCRWCDAKGFCHGAREKVRVEILGDFEEFAEESIKAATETVKKSANEELAHLMGVVDFISEWTKAVMAEADRRLMRGESIPGYKLVQGKQGNRKWSDEEAAEKALRAAKLPVDDIYNKKLASPTSIEKVLKGRERLWKSLQKHITKAPGKPSVATEDDKRPALVLTAKNDFGPDDVAEDINDLC